MSILGPSNQRIKMYVLITVHIMTNIYIIEGVGWTYLSEYEGWICQKLEARSFKCNWFTLII